VRCRSKLLVLFIQALKRTGTTQLLGLGHADRYGPLHATDLLQPGLFANIKSADLVTGDEAEGNIILFQHRFPLQMQDFEGAFLQLNAAVALSGPEDNSWDFDWEIPFGQKTRTC
jgi:hypothetical protein